MESTTRTPGRNAVAMILDCALEDKHISRCALPPTSGSRVRLVIAGNHSKPLVINNSQSHILVGDGLQPWRTSPGIRAVASCSQDQVWLGQRRGVQASSSRCPLAWRGCALSEVGKPYRQLSTQKGKGSRHVTISKQVAWPSRRI